MRFHWPAALAIWAMGTGRAFLTPADRIENLLAAVTVAVTCGFLAAWLERWQAKRRH